MTRAHKTRQRGSEGPEEAVSTAPTRINPRSAEAIEDACCVLDLIDDLVEEAEEVDSDPEPELETYYLAIGAPLGSPETEEWTKSHFGEANRAFEEWQRAMNEWRGRNGVFDPCACG